MKLLSWNYQGLGSTLTFQHLRALVARERPNVVFLMETKNKRDTVDKKKEETQFQFSCDYRPNRYRGGLVGYVG